MYKTLFSDMEAVSRKIEVFLLIVTDALRFEILLASCCLFFHVDFLQDFKLHDLATPRPNQTSSMLIFCRILSPLSVSLRDLPLNIL